MEKEKLLNILKNSEIKNEIDIVDNIYSSLEKKQEDFCQTFCIHCENGCGKCCEHFTPDITYLEAIYIAYGLIIEGKDLIVYDKLKKWDDNTIYCPFYDFANNEHHCTIYYYRPLICRLFGASAVKDKNGKPIFKKCKWNKMGKDVSTEEFLSHPNSLITMEEFGHLLVNNELNYSKTELLPKAVISAIERLNLIINLFDDDSL
ncbi:MAG: YkgJ family cysteine cluster protein [Bacilli bacterium]